ncbi:MAG: hypothetical protein J5523_05430 [Muribaculaceae bacterium]|nr:hypothetical protein [Muribaculaceae bacterium]
MRQLLICYISIFVVGLFACDDDVPSWAKDVDSAVDLGLSVKWAPCNLGASQSYESGGLYGWGDPTGKAVSVDSMDFNQDLETGIRYVKWNYRSLYGGQNPPQDISGTGYDLATKMLGKNWRMPTKREMQELLKYCRWEKTEEHGVPGMKVTGNNGNSIFLPITNFRNGGKVYPTFKDRGYYWSSTLSTEEEEAKSLNYKELGASPCCAGALYFNMTTTVDTGRIYITFEANTRHSGLAIRPVLNK